MATAPSRRTLPPLRIGLTGGIASGKSTVAALFRELGVPVIDLDDVAREVVAPGTTLLAQVIDTFERHPLAAGRALLRPAGDLDRRALRDIVFSDPRARADLEALLHPAIRTRTEEHAAAVDAPYLIIVHPLLAEQDAGARYDRVLVVDAEVQQQRQRLAGRDGATPAQIDALLAAQTDRATRRALADDVIMNDADPTALRDAVARLHRRYLEIARTH